MYYESTLVARRLGISVTRLHQIGAQLDVPAERTDGGRRLYTEDEIARLVAWRADAARRQHAAIGGSAGTHEHRDPR